MRGSKAQASKSLCPFNVDSGDRQQLYQGNERQPLDVWGVFLSALKRVPRKNYMTRRNSCRSCRIADHRADFQRLEADEIAFLIVQRSFALGVVQLNRTLLHLKIAVLVHSILNITTQLFPAIIFVLLLEGLQALNGSRSTLTTRQDRKRHFSAGRTS